MGFWSKKGNIWAFGVKKGNTWAFGVRFCRNIVILNGPHSKIHLKNGLLRLTKWG